MNLPEKERQLKIGQPLKVFLCKQNAKYILASLAFPSFLTIISACTMTGGVTVDRQYAITLSNLDQKMASSLLIMGIRICYPNAPSNMDGLGSHWGGILIAYLPKAVAIIVIMSLICSQTRWYYYYLWYYCHKLGRIG